MPLVDDLVHAQFSVVDEDAAVGKFFGQDAKVIKLVHTTHIILNDIDFGIDLHDGVFDGRNKMGSRKANPDP